MKRQKKTLPKPRNLIAVHAKFRSSAGSHKKPNKSQRTKNKVLLKKGREIDLNFL